MQPGVGNALDILFFDSSYIRDSNILIGEYSSHNYKKSLIWHFSK